jgi:hypothetical protein
VVFEFPIGEEVAKVGWSTVGNDESIDPQRYPIVVSEFSEGSTVWWLTYMCLPEMLKFLGAWIQWMISQVQEHRIAEILGGGGSGRPKSVECFFGMTDSLLK